MTRQPRVLFALKWAEGVKMLVAAPNERLNREDAQLGSISCNPCGVIHAHGWLVGWLARGQKNRMCVNILAF